MFKSAEEKLWENGYEDVIILKNYSYDDALIGVTEDNRAIYDFEKMVQWLIHTENFTQEEAIEWIEYNTIRALPYMGERAPVIMYALQE
jgi:hypothetical protein